METKSIQQEKCSPQQSLYSTQSSCASRERTFQELLASAIKVREEELINLKALSNAFPKELPYKAERILKDLLTGRILC